MPTSNQYGQMADSMSGVRGTANGGMMPYPLYGLGDETAVAQVPFYRKPVFCIGLGAVLGLGVGYSIWGLLLPKVRKNAVNENSRRRHKPSVEEGDPR